MKFKTYFLLLIFTTTILFNQENSENNINFRIDKSNNSNYYSRNLIRNKVLPELEKINPNALHN